jgi:hypothetical protein
MPVAAVPLFIRVYSGAWLAKLIAYASTTPLPEL